MECKQNQAKQTVGFAKHTVKCTVT